MDPISDGCRLCLDPYAESFTTIDSTELKVQMEKVFWYLIKPKQGLRSGVCQSCSYVISEFYQFSEKVRQNQELLNGYVTNCDPAVDLKVEFESGRIETLSDSGPPETAENFCDPNAPTLDSEITVESIKVETLSDTGFPETAEDDCELRDEVSGEEQVRTLESEITLECVKVETVSNYELPDTKEDACEPKDEVSEEEEDVSSSGDDESYEPLPEKSQTRQKERLGKRKLEDLESELEPKKSSKQTTRRERKDKDKIIHKHFRMICDLCGTSAATFKELGTHFRKEHNRQNGYVVCCNKKLFKRNAILAHIEGHPNPDVFRCKVSKNSCKKKDSANTNMRRKHSSLAASGAADKRPFKCVSCTLCFAQKSTLDKHMERHVNVTCPKCNKTIASKNLNRHMRKIHSGTDRTMVCDTCGKGFLVKRNFDRHMNKHKGIEIEVQRVQCEICQLWLKSKWTLQSHMLWAHSDSSQEFQCDLCLKKYPRFLTLYRHKLRTHAELTHECGFCGRKFKTASCLKEHRKIHITTDKVMHTCNFCGASASRKFNLQKHIRVLHPTEWAQMESQKNCPS